MQIQQFPRWKAGDGSRKVGGENGSRNHDFSSGHNVFNVRFNRWNAFVISWNVWKKTSTTAPPQRFFVYIYRSSSTSDDIHDFFEYLSKNGSKVIKKIRVEVFQAWNHGLANSLRPSPPQNYFCTYHLDKVWNLCPACSFNSINIHYCVYVLPRIDFPNRVYNKRYKLIRFIYKSRNLVEKLTKDRIQSAIRRLKFWFLIQFLYVY